jgi:hypothetical protein
MPANDPYTTYEIGIHRLLGQLGQALPRHAEALVYQQCLSENIALTRLHGDTETRRAERVAIIAESNALAWEIGGPGIAPVASAPGTAIPTQDVNPGTQDHQQAQRIGTDQYPACIRPDERSSS